MPKKSKRDKINAEARRRREAQPDQPVTFQFQPPSVPHALVATSVREDSAEFTLIKRDLTKTVVLAAIAILCEFALYWRSVSAR